MSLVVQTETQVSWKSEIQRRIRREITMPRQAVLRKMAYCTGVSESTEWSCSSSLSR